MEIPEAMCVQYVHSFMSLYPLLFFSLRQCPPCRSLTRVLVESYRTVKESGKKFEIVFVSADRYD